MEEQEGRIAFSRGILLYVQVLITLIFLSEQVLAQNFLSSWLLSLNNPVTQVRKGLGVRSLCPLEAVEKSIIIFIIREL